ncbi:M48 family metallopeptidase [Dactylosporangium sp. NBC_01737]|uniref:M48 family metallopeptidase n=1 Tax=Dactylosporangium sp. NBC_01737 TaxID=2975959 RepID=UPI002E127024|nr:M48 family metallopeptidase [Dactylosporangium sp. NBC_01737]
MIAARARVAVALLAGFYVMTVVLLIAVPVAGFVATVALSSRIYLWTAVVVDLIILSAAVQVFVARPPSPTGVRLTVARAPELWHVVRGLAALTGTREPDEIRLVATPRVRVVEEAGLLGLRGGWVTLEIGAPLLPALTVTELTATIGHELSRLTRRHEGAVAVAHRGQVIVGATAAAVRNALVQSVFLWYAKLYGAVAGPIDQLLDREADQTLTAVAGREGAAETLRRTAQLEAAWRDYHDEYVTPLRERGYVAADMFDGFARFTAERGAPPVPAQTRDRIAAIAAGPPATVAPDTRPAQELISEERAEVLRQLEAGAFQDTGFRVMPWEQLSAQAATNAAQLDANRLLEPAGGDVHEVLRRLSDGRVPWDTDTVAALRGLVVVTMLDAGAATWRHSWTGPAQLVDREGDPVDLAATDLAAALARAAVRS